jgi:hypothetical protein
LKEKIKKKMKQVKRKKRKVKKEKKEKRKKMELIMTKKILVFVKIENYLISF